MRTKLGVSGWILLLSILTFSSVWAGPGSDSIQFPSLKTDGEKLAFLIEIKQKIPKLFSDAAMYDIDLFSLLDDEAQLLKRLKSNPKYLHEFENKSYDEITVTPPPEGLEVGTKKIKSEAIQHWKSELYQSLQELKEELKAKLNVGKGGISPEKALSSQINSTVESLANSGDLSNLSGKKFGRLLAEFGREKQNQALFNEKIGKAKDLDLKGRLTLVLELYDQFPVKPHTVTKGHLEQAIQFLSEVEKLIALSTLQVVLHRPGQTENADGTPWESWKAAEDSLNRLNGQDLEFFLDKQDALAPLVRSLISHHEPQLIEAIFKGIEFYAQQTEGGNQRATEKIRLTQVPPAVGIFRGCTGGDCSSQYSFPYPNDPHERVFFIYDSEDKLKGYVSSTEVMAQGKPSLYIITMSGSRVNAADTELVLRALERAKEQLGVKNILLPEPSKLPGLINFQEIRGVYEAYTRHKHLIPIHYQDPDLRQIIEGYEGTQFNSGQYDHMSNNQHGVVLKFSDQKSSQLSVHHERLSETRILPKPVIEMQNSDIVEFLLDLNKSGRRSLIQKVTQIQEVRSKINLKHFIELTENLLKKCTETAGNPLSVQTYRHQVQTLFSELGMDSNYLENHLSLLYPGIVHCQDPYSDQNVNLTTEFIIKDMKENEGLCPGINLSTLKGSDTKAISQSAPFLKYYNQLAQQISDPSFKLSQKVVTAFALLQELDDLKIKDLALAHTLFGRLKSSDVDVRWLAKRLLKVLNSRNPAIAHALAEHLKDPDINVKYTAIIVLGEIQSSDPAIAHALAEHLKDPDHWVRRAVVFALDQIKPSDSAIVHALVESLKDPDGGVKYQAIVAMRGIKSSDPAIAHALVELLKDPSFNVRSAVVQVLGEINPRDPAIVNALVESLKDPDDRVRYFVKRALEKIQGNHINSP